MKTTWKARALVVLVSSLALAVTPARATTVKPYLVSMDAGLAIAPLLSAGDRVPLTGDATKEYQMVGIPDGLGAHAADGGTVAVYMNHEFTTTTTSEPFVGGPLNRGAIVSRYVLDQGGTVLSGARAYDTSYVGDTLVGPAADASNTTPAFGRFCSGSLAWREHGFDRPIYLTGEESDAPATFDGMGGLTVAIYDGQAHAIPEMGRFSKENTVVQPGTNARTVAFTLEDGPSGPDSQLYMYVGAKILAAPSALARNGLSGGKLYALKTAAQSEAGFASGSIVGTWVEIQGAASMTAAQLEAASDTAGAHGFVRIEDGAFNPADPSDFYFVTTGGNRAAGNELGRLYQLKLNPADPTQAPILRVVYNADAIVAAGGDTALSPDNIDASDTTLMVQEDGTTQSRAVMAAKGRDGSIWSLDISHPAWTKRASAWTRVAELDPAGRDGVAVGPGVWESSGVIDTSALFGEGSWLVDVQAHAPTGAPASGTVEDGQLLLIRPA